MDLIKPYQVNYVLFSLALYSFFIASDNLVHNMENQMRINELHIDSLRKQNDSLKSSLENVLLINNSTNLSKTNNRRLKKSVTTRTIISSIFPWK